MSVAKGDRVQILCASSASDGTPLDSDALRKKPYWIRAGAAAKRCDASVAVVGMRVGDRKTVVVGEVTMELEVVTIRRLSA